MNWKDKIYNESMEDSCMHMHLEGDNYEDNEVSSKLLISKKLPFLSMRDFNCSMIGSLKSGTVCFSLFAYHHFLSLIKDVRSAMKNIDSKVTTTEIGIEYKNLKEKICRKNKVFNHWLENAHSYSRSHDPDVTEPSITDINIMLAIEIVDCILYSKSGSNREFCDIIPRQKSYFDTNPTIELNDDKFQLSDTTDSHLSPDLSAESSIYLESQRPMLCMSYSTPDFHHYFHHHHERTHKLSDIETAYQNISSNDTFHAMNHTFPKQTNAESSHHKEGSFKRFRRKCSPNIFIPFIRRKTSSTHSTVSEPICHNDSKEQNSYYNMSNRRDIHSKKSLSVVLDSQHYVNMKQAPNYINVSQMSGTALSTNSSNYINTDPPVSDDDDTPYPDEIIDPSRNYGDLNFIKSRLRYTRYDNDLLGFRRASFSILSQNSIDSFNKRAYPSISRVHSDACHHSSNYRSLYCFGSSPHSLLSCGHCRHLPPPQPPAPAPQSLNYVTVIENHPSKTLPNKITKPLSIFTDTDPHHHHQHKNNTNSNTSKPYRGRHTWLSPQSSPIVDYCQIDLNCTYALRDIDQKLYNKLKLRDRHSLKNTKNRSPDDVESSRSLEQMSDNHSLASLSLMKEKKSSHKTARNSFRQLFSRKADWLS